jgi:signal transduction histidine kinase
VLPTARPPQPAPLRWRHWLGVQARSALAATVIVALALALAAGALVLLLQRSLIAGIDAGLVSSAREVAAEIAPAAPGSPNSSDRDDALDAAVAAVARQRTIIQVLSPQGTVLASSADIEGEGFFTKARPRPGRLVRENLRLPVEDEDAFRVLSLGVGTDEGTYTVTTGQSLDPVDDSTTAVVALLAVGYPLLLVVVGASTFWFVGRSLRPVGAIRAKVASIGGRELTGRVPVPAARDEVARLAVTMNEMLDRLEAAQRSQRRFVADASHELRSPIATLKASAEVALAHPGQSDRGGVAEGVLAETQRLERLVNDLLLLARADERGLHPDRRVVDLDDLLIAEQNRIRATTDLTVTTRISAVQIVGDAHQLAQVLRNLIDNATRHATTGIDLALRRDGDDAVVEIADDGPGIPVADRRRVFDRFVRLDESRERARGGSGLGLAIVHEIVNAHGGTIRVGDNAPGATLRLTLPVGPVTATARPST